MNEAADSPCSKAEGFLKTAWPAPLASDSEPQRRKKRIVRGMQWAVVLMVGAAVIGAIAANYRQLSSVQIGCLVLASVLYAAWNIHGMRDAISLLLWEQGAHPPLLRSPKLRSRHALHFTVQLALAASIYFLGDRGKASTVLWLILLPPIAHSVVLLRWPGIALVTLLSTLILMANVVHCLGWEQAPSAFLLFSFAALFTCIFTQLAVSSEKSRAEVQQLAGQLGEANLKLREYAVQMEELAATRERNRIAREIHDTLGHYLTVVNVQIAAARAVRDNDPECADKAMEKAQALTREGLQEIRRSVAALRATPLDNKSLPEALSQVLESHRAAGLDVSMAVLGNARVLSPQAELTLYRAGQEGLTNTRKHAQAGRAKLTLDYRSAERVCLIIDDNGVGAAPETALSGGFGLLGLRERAQLLGGCVRVRTALGAGFTLELEAPG